MRRKASACKTDGCNRPPIRQGIIRLSRQVSDAAPPPLDWLLDPSPVAVLCTCARKGCGRAFRTAVLWQRAEAYSHRHRHTFPDGDGLAVAQGWQEAHQPVGGFRDGAAHNVLILMAGHAEGEHRITFGQ